MSAVPTRSTAVTAMRPTGVRYTLPAIAWLRFQRRNVTVIDPSWIPTHDHFANSTGNPGSVEAAGHVREPRVLREEGEVGDARGTRAVLGHDDLGLAGVLRLRVVDLLAVDEHHHVGVLLDR